MTYIKIIKGDTTEIIERDVNSFTAKMYKQCYEEFGKFTVDDIKLTYNKMKAVYIAMIIYHID